MPSLAQRPNTCATTTGAQQSYRNVKITHDAVAGRSGNEAWMAFQHRRSGNGSETVTTPMTWPGTWRPPAGVTSLELSFKQQRFASTAQPGYRIARNQPRRLQPLKHNDKSSTKGSRHLHEPSNEQQPHSSWAQKWATLRSEQTNVLFKGVSEKEVRARVDKQCTLGNEYRNARKPRRKRKETILSLSEKEAASMKQLRGVYANSTEKVLRTERLRDSIKALQSKTLHTEIDSSMKEYRRKIESDKNNRSELRRVRERYQKDKKRRDLRSHISQGALDTPQVSRLAYGLPEDGREFEETKIGAKTERRLKEIWQNAVKRTLAIDKLINAKSREDITLPRIRIKRRSTSKLSNHATPDTERKTSANSYAGVQVALGELEVMSSVGSDFDDNLTDIGEDEEDGL
ncbi:uncharacterized protein LOC116603437 isoform X2 [Nematostella vectensis]|uniref:uncharacterized protein LOC116603437 isoform X2 n=1 Tax=Nematostella vectensis TaxID=45351 RepID=UPI002076FE7E|nr:uncharacterized protein LOC116603437 isoform X2 [Nematostella vectensis]